MTLWRVGGVISRPPGRTSGDGYAVANAPAADPGLIGFSSNTLYDARQLDANRRLRRDERMKTGCCGEGIPDCRTRGGWSSSTGKQPGVSADLPTIWLENNDPGPRFAV